MATKLIVVTFLFNLKKGCVPRVSRRSFGLLAQPSDDLGTDDVVIDPDWVGGAQASIFDALRNRQSELDAENARVLRNWRKANAKSYVGASISDYVRRAAVQWPLVALGTASGAVVVTSVAPGNQGRIAASFPNWGSPC